MLFQVNAKYCQFPPSGLNQVSVYAEDYVCLEDESFLNDVIIDFYLRYLQFNIMSEVCLHFIIAEMTSLN